MPVPLRYPVYIVVEFQSESLAVALIVDRIADGTRGVAVFTDEVAAENYRDHWRREAELVKLNSHSEMTKLIDDFQRRLNATHLAIDPSAYNGRQATWVALADLT